MSGALSRSGFQKDVTAAAEHRSGITSVSTRTAGKPAVAPESCTSGPENGQASFPKPTQPSFPPTNQDAHTPGTESRITQRIAVTLRRPRSRIAPTSNGTMPIEGQFRKCYTDAHHQRLGCTGERQHSRLLSGRRVSWHNQEGVLLHELALRAKIDYTSIGT